MQELARSSKPEWVDRAWLQIGLIRKADGRLAEAAEAFATLERVTPKSSLGPEAQLQRAWYCCGSSVTPRPSPCCERPRVMPRPRRVRGRLGTGDNRARAKQPEAARGTLESALQQFPDSPLLPAMHFRLAEVLSSNTVSLKPRRNSNRWPTPIPTIPGPTMRSSEPRRPRSIARTSRGARRSRRRVRGAISPEPAQGRGPADRGPRGGTRRQVRRGGRAAETSRRA